MELTAALQAIAQQATGTPVSHTDVKNMLANVRGVTFAKVTQVTKVALAAANKDLNILKVTVANVQLFNNLKDFTTVYADAVKRRATKLGVSKEDAIQAFVPSGNYFEHTDCYSIVKHKTQDKHYLYAVYNSADSLYIRSGKVMSKAEVAVFMTPSGAKALLDDSGVVHNKTNDVTHDVIVRTVGMDSIVSIVAQKQQLTV